jgi:hypothetical protein
MHPPLRSPATTPAANAADRSAAGAPDGGRPEQGRGRGRGRGSAPAAQRAGTGQRASAAWRCGGRRHYSGPGAPPLFPLSGSRRETYHSQRGRERECATRAWARPSARAHAKTHARPATAGGGEGGALGDPRHPLRLAPRAVAGRALSIENSLPILPSPSPAPSTSLSPPNYLSLSLLPL